MQIKMIVLMSPITLFWFGETSLLGLATNLIVVPVVTMMMVPMGLMGLLLFEAAPAVADELWWGGAQLWQLLRVVFDGLLRCCRPLGSSHGKPGGIAVWFGVACSGFVERVSPLRLSSVFDRGTVSMAR
jgi:predicted membrane metal-binding protein